MELRGTLRMKNVLCVPEIKSVISFSVIEKKGFDIVFQDEKALINPREYRSNKAVVFGV
jgi:hypothetical protein